MTFKQYVTTYKEVWGWVAGGVAVSGPLFGIFEIVTPPAEGAGLLTLVSFLAALLLPYLLIRGFHLSAQTLARLAIGAVTMGFGALLYYLAVVYPTYVYVDTISGPQARTIRKFWATEDGFSEEVRSKLDAWNRDGMGTNRLEVVRGFGIPNIESVFTAAALDHARRRVFIWFAWACLLIELGLCSLAASEGLRNLAGQAEPETSAGRTYKRHPQPSDLEGE